jgi:hypothetical protein
LRVLLRRLKRSAAEHDCQCGDYGEAPHAFILLRMLRPGRVTEEFSYVPDQPSLGTSISPAICGGSESGTSGRSAQHRESCEAVHIVVSCFALDRSLQDIPGFQGRRFRMKLLIIVSFIAAVGLLAATQTDIQRSHSGLTTGRAETASTSTLHDMQSARSMDKLPAEDFDDRSLVYPRETKR